MKYNIMFSKVQSFRNNDISDLSDFEAIKRLREYLNFGTVQTIQAFKGFDRSSFIVSSKDTPVFYRTILKLSCTEGLYAVDLKQEEVVQPYTTYLTKVELLNPDIQFDVHKGIETSRVTEGFNSDKKSLMAKAHRLIDDLPEDSLRKSNTVEELLEEVLIILRRR